MGLFCLGLEKTPVGQIEAAIGNLKIFEGLIAAYEGIPDKYGNSMPDYLIGMAKHQLIEALKYLQDANVNNKPVLDGPIGGPSV